MCIAEGSEVIEKIIELETKFSFQEDLLAALNDEVVRQQRQIVDLLRELSVIKLQVAELIERDSKPAPDSNVHEVPPHY